MSKQRERKNRTQAMEENIEWLQEHDLDEHSKEAAKRLGIIKGDAEEIINTLGDN